MITVWLFKLASISIISLSLGTLLYFIEGADAFNTILPLLIITFLVGCMNIVIADLRMTLNWLFPRRLRLQLGLEFSYFWWNEAGNDPVARKNVMFYLRIAQRAASGTKMKVSIDGIARRLMDNSDNDESTISNDFNECLASLSPKPRSVFPILRSFILPVDSIIPLSVLFALATLLIREQMIGMFDFSFMDLLFVLILISLFREVFKFIHFTVLTVFSILNKARFRTVIVSDKPPDESLNLMGVNFYSEVGQVIAAFVDASPAYPWLDIERKNTDFFTPDSDSLDHLLQAFVPCADLIVINTDNDELADKISSFTTLPVSRCLALGEDNSVPLDYLWVEPTTLRIKPSWKKISAIHENPDYYSMGVIPGKSLWKNWMVQAGVIVCFTMLWIEDSLPLNVLVGLSIIGIAFPDLLGPIRRKNFSHALIRAPLMPAFSQKLQPKQLEFRICILLWGFTIIIWLFMFWAAEFSFAEPLSIEMLPLFLLLPVSLLLVHLGLVGGLLRALKWYIDWNFRILVFRRNTRHFGYAHKSVVMANCGKYGQVIIVGDRSLDSTDQETGEWRESSEGMWLQIFSEMNQSLKPDALLHNWQRQVIMELEIADFAVFDWAEDISKNMEWELDKALERLPGDRILIIHSTEQVKQVEALLDLFSGQQSDLVRCICYSRGRDDQYIWSDHTELAALFDHSLYQMMAMLKEEKRISASKLSRGTWPLPGTDNY